MNEIANEQGTQKMEGASNSYTEIFWNQQEILPAPRKTKKNQQNKTLLLKS